MFWILLFYDSLILIIHPFFQQAASVFDESGVKGLLLNNISIRNETKLLFDSGDVKEMASASGESVAEGELGGEEPLPASIAGMEGKGGREGGKGGEEGKCKGEEFFYFINIYSPSIDIIRLNKQETKKLQICPHFANFSFANWDKNQVEEEGEEEGLCYLI